MLKILHRTWPAPPQMSRVQYFKYRMRLLTFMAIWLLILIGLAFFWNHLHILIKGIFIMLGYIFSPDFSMIEQIFVSYEKYLKDGLVW